MESTNRSRGRKRYCCCYCNVYFYQIDSWQRHNRKHTGVEIECDDCGEMCSDSFELKSHQQMCEAYRVYSEELFTEESGDHRTERKIGKEQSHDTPDSTSKQELTNDVDEQNQTRSPWRLSGSRTNDGETSPVVSGNEDSNKNSELDDLIGEDRDTSGAMEVADDGPNQEENEDPETEALIGVDETLPEIKTENLPSSKPVDNSIGVDSQIVIKVDSALNDAKRSPQKLMEKSARIPEGPSFLGRPQSGPPGPENMQVMNLENSELNKKYQPYFCKNCGARFTRKDSVTRHLKKGTCSGKSAIVCSICGKVFPELFELQQHFKLDHKNVLLAPTLVTHRTILPKPADHQEPSRPQHFNAYPAPFVLREPHHPPGSRPLPSNETQYRTISQHGIQGVFYPPNGSQTSYRHRSNYPPSNHGGHYRDQHYPSGRQYDLKYSPNGSIRKDGSDKMLMEKMNRKRAEFHNRDHYSDRDESYMGKRNKLDYETSHEKTFLRDQHIENKNQINLSEYTNNAMNSQQYFSKRFIPKDKQSSAAGGSENEPSNQVHQCKICGNEFPRFEYLLTHLRKHKEKPDQEEEGKTTSTHHERQDNSSNNSNEPPSDTIEKRSNNLDPPKPIFSSNHEPVTVVMQQPAHLRYNENIGADSFLQPVDQSPVYALPPPPNQTIGENNIEAITPGVDGKFRPFICENCGQRFTRKDSLVRHAKKQTCYEEQTDLKCKHCDKTFRYHKCLVQHQELIHGISREEQSNSNPVRNSEDEDTDSDRSDKNDNLQDDKRNAEEAKKYRSPTNSLMDLSSKPSKHQNFLPPTHPVMSHHQQRINFAGTPFAQLENPANPPAPKFIPPRAEEKVKVTHHQTDVNGPLPGNSQDTQYIGYCTVPRPFQCEYCGDRFAHRHSLKRHIRRHLGIGIPCSECGKLYRDQSEWRRHQRSIHNRHYEKYEVPSRISFRDGVENGMIGVVQGNEYSFENNDGSDSDKSDEEFSMVSPSKSSFAFNMRTNEDARKQESKKLSEVTNQSSTPVEAASMTDDGPSALKTEDKENKQVNKSFNFNLHTAGDKDSRKSALDRYLRSSNSDEDEDETSDKNEIDEKKSSIENNNNNNLDELNKVSNHGNTVILADTVQI